MTDQNRTAFFDELTLEVLHRAAVWNGTTCTSGMAAPFCGFLQKLDSGRCVSLFVIGGSTTFGNHVNGSVWYKHLMDWLTKRFPCVGGHHRIQPYAMPGGGSTSHLGYLPTLAADLKSLDLIILELGANDWRVEDAPHTEALVYSLVALQPQAALMILTTASPLEFFQRKFSISRYDELPESKNHLPTSLHLSLPLVSIPFAMFTSPARSGNISSNLYAEGAKNPASPLFHDKQSCGASRCLLWFDGLHMTHAGHSLTASAIAMFFVAMIPRVRGVTPSPVNLTTLLQHTRFPEAKELMQTKLPLLPLLFASPSLPVGFFPPRGWELINERDRFGLAAFAICEQQQQLRHNTTIDPCSDPLPIPIGGSTLMLNMLYSYAHMGIIAVTAPPDVLFDVCESNGLNSATSLCFVDGHFEPGSISIPMFAKMHIVPKDAGQKLTFPLNLTLHIASSALAEKVARNKTSFEARGRQKIKILGWYSFA